MSGSTLDLAQRLIALPSVTPHDGGCLDLIAGRLQPLGFVCERIDVGGVSNLWAHHGQGSPRFCFAGHTDVVPPGPLDQWTSPPFTPTLRQGRLYGRGAADMKSSVAAMVVAMEAFVAGRLHRHGSLSLLLTSDEEGDSVDGTVRVVERLQERGETIDYCVVGEPTSVAKLADTVKNGRRGSMSGKLVVKGIQGHVAYPELVRNPVHLAAPALAELAATRWDDGNEHFPPTSFQISNIHAGTGAGNVVPGRMEVDFNFRFSTASTVSGLQYRVAALLDRHGLDYELHWVVGAKPFLTAAGRLVDVVAESVATVCGYRPQLSTSGGTSDGRFIADICPEVIELGPINASIHKVDEHVLIDDLDPLAAIYGQILTRLLG